jgi:STE24 endopeptidase
MMGGVPLQPRLNIMWWFIIFLAGFFSLLFLWYTLFPGRVAPEALRYFDPAQVNLGREYSRVQRLLFIGSFAAQAIFLIWLATGGRLLALSRLTGHYAGGNYWGSVLFFFLALWVALQLINLPFQFLGNYYWQHHWGFSTQTMSSWWLDYVKGSGLDLALTAAAVMVFFWIARRWPGSWWLVGATLVTLWLIIQSYLWPVLVSPLFNRFIPSGDPAVISMVRDLSQRARLPVDQVLVMDASKRTTRANAYFTGLGQTKRIVLYDTLLNNYPLDEVRAVLAHEMAHWSRGHVSRGLALGVAGNFILWWLLFVLLRSTVPHQGAFPPYTWALAMLFFLMTSFLSSPLQNYISRGMEREADSVSVTLTGDAGAAERLQVNLAVKNLSDVSPPPFIAWFSYSHPPAPERIAIIRGAALK